MEHKRTFRLIKDLPSLKAGAIFSKTGWEKINYPNQDMTDLYATPIKVEGGTEYRHKYSAAIVENDAEWFEEIIEVAKDPVIETMNEQIDNLVLNKEFYVRRQKFEEASAYREKEKTLRAELLAYKTKKAEEIPLLTTEDGKPIYEGDKHFPVTDDFQLLYSSFATKNDVGIRTFLTQAAANDYIAENKPINLSMKEIKGVLKKIVNEEGMIYYNIKEAIIEASKNKK